MTLDFRHYITLIQESYTYHNSPEEWVRTIIQGEEVNVHWQKDKNEANVDKHEYSLGVAIHALNDPHALRSMDDMAKEFREITLCKGPDGNILFVIWSWLDTGEKISTIRIISVRKAEPFEKAEYVNSMTTNPKNITETPVPSNQNPGPSHNFKVEPFGPWFRNEVQRRKQAATAKNQ